MPERKSFDINKLIEGSLQSLRTEAEYFSTLTDHGPELGRLNETHLVKILRSYLPPKIGIGTGFIASGGATPRQSPQYDIILYDALNNVPLYNSDTWSIYPIEMVYGVIEVKTTLTNSTLRDALQKCAEIRTMATDSTGAPNKLYLRLKPAQINTSANYEIITSNLPPRFFVFGYNGWKMITGLKNNFERLSDENLNAHVHGVCNLFKDGSLYVRHNAFKEGTLRYSTDQNNGFRYFLMNLLNTLNSMLNHNRMGLGFDQLYLDHYKLEIL